MEQTERQMVTVKVASEITGLTIKTIRFYEKARLIAPTKRSSSGYRLYSKEDIFRLQQIRLYREQQFSLDEISEILETPGSRLRGILKRQLYKIENQIQELEHIRLRLNNAITVAACGQSPYQKDALDSIGQHHTAIVGVDLQNDFLEDGALPCHRFYNIIRPLSQLFEAGRAANIPIVYVCDSHHPGDSELEIWKEHAMEGTWGAEIIKELAPKPQDYVVKKGYFNAFFQTNLQQTLNKLGVDTIIMVGWRTHVCVAQTVIEAFNQGYQVIIAEDGVDSTTLAEHEFGLNLLRANYEIPTLPCEKIIEYIAQSGKQDSPKVWGKPASQP
ncbi:isochorismatase family protein [Anaerotruncus colihominis]|uniref:isochorismatase family protein n=1 Tax=Anaerotruncus colihominis TaxID=169435 RepID=UPI0026F24106|nr:isochorismatase family protein [Anaerotruncus colihominis]